MRVVIIEDEGIAAEKLTKMLTRLAPDFEIVASLDSVKSSIQWFQVNIQPSLIFMDIQLSDGISFEILDKVELTTPIIFTTAYDQYAIQAFKVNSIDYLLKPIAEEALERALKKFNDSLLSPSIPIDILKSITQPKALYKNRFVIKTGEHLRTVLTDSIEIFYSQNKATYILTKESHKYIIDNTLDQLETMLDPALFFRINRSNIIALNSIKDIISYSSSRLKLILDQFDEEELIVSRERVNKFKLWLEG